MDIVNEETIKFDLGNGAMTRRRIRIDYGSGGVKILDRLVDMGMVETERRLVLNQYTTYYRLSY